MLTPLTMHNPLAGNPTQDPEWSVTCNSKSSNWPGAIKMVDPKATRALVALMDMSAVLGGAASHYGGPAAFAELMSAIHAVVFTDAKKQGKTWHDLYNVINDAGHCENGLYALKANYGFAGLRWQDLKKFRSIESKLTGHGESHLFPEGVQLSNGPLGSAFPQAQGLAMADALSGTARVTITAISDGASMEGEAREAYAAIPGLARAGKLAPFIAIISDNNTKLTGRIDKDSFSMEPTFASLPALGWKVISLPDGHNLQACLDAVMAAVEETRKNPKTPIAIHAKTIKGIGTKKTAESSSGGHGFPLKSPTELPAFLAEIYDGQAVPGFMADWVNDLVAWEKQIKAQTGPAGEPTEKIQTGVSSAMSKARKAGLPVVSVTSDLPGSTGTSAFRKDFAEGSFDVGVAESNMISAAAGFSKAGFIPVVDTFAQFGVTKGALPLTMASLSDAAMICVFSHTGFQDAADGASHQALSYIAMLSSIPNLDLYTLSCTEEADALVTQAIEKFAADRKAGKHPRTSVFFLGRENFPKSYKSGLKYNLGQAQVLHDSSQQFPESISLFACGSMVPQALLAAKELEAQKIGAVVVHPSQMNHPDTQTLFACLDKTKNRLVIVEDHQSIGGFAHLFSASLVQNNRTARAKFLGVPGEFGQSAYNAIDLYQKYHLDSASIVRAARGLLEK